MKGPNDMAQHVVAQAISFIVEPYLFIVEEMTGVVVTVVRGDSGWW